MATRILLTIDTELAWRHSAGGAGWAESFARSFDPAGVGIPWQLDQLARHDLRACFFVDPMPALLYGIAPIRRMVEPILAAGQEVQLHLHSFWHDLVKSGRDGARFELTDFDAAGQQDLIATARDLLISAGAPPPTAFRSGSFAVDADTIRALRRLGLRHDSSHNGADHPWPSALALDPALIDPVELDGVTEIPVTQIRRPDGGLRPFQLCALSTREMRAALRHADAQNHPLVTIVSHSFELASRDARRINGVVKRRFERLCAFLDAHRETMPTVRFDALADFPPGTPSQPLAPSRLRTGLRIAEQAWGNARYEKPGMAAAAVAVPLAAVGWLAHAAF